MSSHPVYRTGNHAYACRCGRCPQSRPTEWGIIGPALLVIGAIAVFGFWPAFFVHGESDTGGYTWTAATTYAVLTWIGVLGFIVFLCWLGNRPAHRTARPPKGRLPVEVLPAPAAPPACLHRDAVEVDSAYWRNLGREVIFCCWCPDCGGDLPASFRLPCCGIRPGTGIKPAVHMYNCPYRRVKP